MSRGAGVGAGESGLIQMPLSLGASDDVVDGSSSFKFPNTVEREILGSNPSLSSSSTTRKIYTIKGKFFFLYKKLSTLLFQLYKTLPLEVGNQKHPVPFFLWDIVG
ncbi:uncharacterized protein LOC126731911 [Quercus robur]|uniref:uncharacterized protein LOC126731911 n=1 Tax=Quercus robur TaxID=38942 RepID=UPI00216165BE|nr:uncharacterized protein LOC126731911 [Quercus robur]